MPDATDEVSEEDRKLVTLARAGRAREGASEGAAVRDRTGRTYVAVTVELASLSLTALQAAVVIAAASGADALEAAAVVTGSPGTVRRDLDAVRDLGGVRAQVHLADPAGTVVETIRPD